MNSITKNELEIGELYCFLGYESYGGMKQDCDIFVVTNKREDWYETRTIYSQYDDELGSVHEGSPVALFSYKLSKKNIELIKVLFND